MKRALLAIAGVLASVASCGERELPFAGQLVVHVDTDAPLGLAPGTTLTPDAPAPLFDRIRIEILDESGAIACAACADELSVDRDQAARHALSFGVKAPGRSGLSVRARLFRGNRERGAIPPPDATIDRFMRLPSIPDDGIFDVTLPLMLDQLGVAATFDDAEPALAGDVAHSTLHEGVAPAPCTAAPDDGQICVRGGAFWMSDPSILPSPTGEVHPARVAILSPFWLDASEVTVAAFRASGLATSSDPLPIAPCTFTTAASANDSLPVTCISWAKAASYCAARGGRLPTEAEIELLLSARGLTRFPWGDDEPTCTDSIYARVDPADPRASDSVGQAALCASFGVGPRPAGEGNRDVVSLPGGAIHDLAGNVIEWTADVYQDLGGSCWGGGVVVDPSCNAGASASALRTVRGGSWISPRLELRATNRRGQGPTASNLGLGFRCARDGR